MKRDLNLVRRILLEIEKQPFDPDWVPIAIEEYAPEIVNYHLMIMAEAGLIKVIDLSAGDEMRFLPRWITWQGHDFLDAVRDESRWSTVKTVITNVNGVTLDIVKSVASDLIKTQVNQYLS